MLHRCVLRFGGRYVVLLGPQIRFQKNKIAAQIPNVPVDAIDMRMYGRMDGKGALALARKLMND